MNLLYIFVGIAILIIAGVSSAIAFRAYKLKAVISISKLFNDASQKLNTLDKLDEENISIRMEGIYALQRLAENAPNGRERQRAVDALCQYLRNHRSVDAFAEPDTFLEEDEKAIIRALVQLSQMYKSRIRVDLSRTNLYFADFRGAYLEGADFMGAYCEDAFFGETNCKKALFIGADCMSTMFTEAYCEGAVFEGAHCEGANFSRSYCKNAGFSGAHCERADFIDANCENATFWGVHCEKADFTNAIQDAADFRYTKDVKKAIGLEYSKIIY